MGLFFYEVFNTVGEIVKGKLEAPEEEAVADKLRKMGYFVIDIKEIRPSPLSGLLKGKVKIGAGELGLFSRQLAAMLDAGVPLTRSLYTLSSQMTNKGFGRIVGEISRSVEGGMNFAESLSAYPHVFPSLFTGMVRAGEVGGVLQESLIRLSEQLQRDKVLQDSLRSATFYPAAIGVFALLVLLGMLIFLVPVFMGFFPPDMRLPLPTQIVVLISESLRYRWYIWFLAVTLLLFALFYYVRSAAGRRHWDLIKFRIPLFGPLFHRAAIAQFARTLSTLFGGGIPVVQALEAAGAATGNIRLQEAAKDAAEKVQEGKSITIPLSESPVFPPMVTQMVSIGEETGALPDLLNRIASFFEDEVAVLTKGLTAMIEPIMLIVVGLTVGAILISLYLPMFIIITEQL
ncbi:MAG TPA: type II secretion system F family protein [Firmicutes bacterium]|nr:type II secretion system F family protein [Bacillota bacterium]